MADRTLLQDLLPQITREPTERGLRTCIDRILLGKGGDLVSMTMWRLSMWPTERRHARMHPRRHPRWHAVGHVAMRRVHHLRRIHHLRRHHVRGLWRIMLLYRNWITPATAHSVTPSASDSWASLGRCSLFRRHGQSLGLSRGRPGWMWSG